MVIRARKAHVGTERVPSAKRPVPVPTNDSTPLCTACCVVGAAFAPQTQRAALPRARTTVHSFILSKTKRATNACAGKCVFPSHNAGGSNKKKEGKFATSARN